MFSVNCSQTLGLTFDSKPDANQTNKWLTFKMSDYTEDDNHFEDLFKDNIVWTPRDIIELQNLEKGLKTEVQQFEQNSPNIEQHIHHNMDQQFDNNMDHQLDQQMQSFSNDLTQQYMFANNTVLSNTNSSEAIPIKQSTATVTKQSQSPGTQLDIINVDFNRMAVQSPTSSLTQPWSPSNCSQSSVSPINTRVRCDSEPIHPNELHNRCNTSSLSDCGSRLPPLPYNKKNYTSPLPSFGQSFTTNQTNGLSQAKSYSHIEQTIGQSDDEIFPICDTCPFNVPPIPSPSVPNTESVSTTGQHRERGRPRNPNSRPSLSASEKRERDNYKVKYEEAKRQHLKQHVRHLESQISRLTKLAQINGIHFKTTQQQINTHTPISIQNTNTCTAVSTPNQTITNNNPIVDTNLISGNFSQNIENNQLLQTNNPINCNNINIQMMPNEGSIHVSNSPDYYNVIQTSQTNLVQTSINQHYTQPSNSYINPQMSGTSTLPVMQISNPIVNQSQSFVPCAHQMGSSNMNSTDIGSTNQSVSDDFDDSFDYFDD